MENEQTDEENPIVKVPLKLINLVGFIASVEGREPDTQSIPNYTDDKKEEDGIAWEGDGTETEEPVTIWYTPTTLRVQIGICSDERTYPIAGYCAVHDIPYEVA